MTLKVQCVCVCCVSAVNTGRKTHAVLVSCLLLPVVERLEHSLFRVLCAHAVWDGELGYCQGAVPLCGTGWVRENGTQHHVLTMCVPTHSRHELSSWFLLDRGTGPQLQECDAVHLVWRTNPTLFLCLLACLLPLVGFSWTRRTHFGCCCMCCKRVTCAFCTSLTCLFYPCKVLPPRMCCALWLTLCAL